MANIIYKAELTKAMKLLADDDKSIFIGQGTLYGGISMYPTMRDVPKNKIIEVPVFEDTQCGMSLGMALEGYTVISIFPRMDFLICATNQIVNHLDKIGEMSEGQFNPKVIIRTAIGSSRPLMPGPQHCQDYTEAFKSMCKYINVVKLERAEYIVPAYEAALKSNKPSMLIEVPESYLSRGPDNGKIKS